MPLPSWPRRGWSPHRRACGLGSQAPQHRRRQHRPPADLHRGRLRLRHLQRRDLQLPPTPRGPGIPTHLHHRDGHRSARPPLRGTRPRLRRAPAGDVRVRPVGRRRPATPPRPRPDGDQAAAAGRRRRGGRLRLRTTRAPRIRCGPRRHRRARRL